jgi:hypothetical protein
LAVLESSFGGKLKKEKQIPHPAKGAGIPDDIWTGWNIGNGMSTERECLGNRRRLSRRIPGGGGLQPIAGSFHVEFEELLFIVGAIGLGQLAGEERFPSFAPDFVNEKMAVIFEIVVQGGGDKSFLTTDEIEKLDQRVSEMIPLAWFHAKTHDQDD